MKFVLGDWGIVNAVYEVSDEPSKVYLKIIYKRKINRKEVYSKVSYTFGRKAVYPMLVL